MQQLRPTFSESWYRVAKLKVRLRPSAQVSRQHYRGDRWYVVRDPTGNQYHRLSAPAYRFVGLLDGTRTVEEAWELVGGQLADDAPTQGEVIQILSQLHAANLIEADITPDAEVLLRRQKKQQKRQWQSRAMNLLFPRVPIWDPDRFLCRWLPVVRPFLGPLGVVLWLAVVGAAVLALVPRWVDLKAGAANAIDGFENLVFLWASFVVIKAIHELGHAFSCRRFGGEVHELGIMLLVLVPTPYVDASSAWQFPSKWARIFVGAAGMVVEMFVAAVMAFVWLNTSPDTLVNKLAYNVMLIASVSTLLFNANPLLRYDGYYMLSDWLEIPNLRQKSNEYTLGLIKRHLFGVKSPLPLPPLAQRAWLFAYSVASCVYRMFIGFVIILMVFEFVPVLGIIMAFSAVATFLLLPLGKGLHYLLLSPELHRKRSRAWAWTAAATALVVALVGFVPLPVRFYGRGIVEPAEKTVLHARQGGVVRSILAPDGARVSRGQPLLVMENLELEADHRRALAELDELEALELESRTSNQAMRQAYLRQIEAKKREIDDLKRRLDELVLRAGIDGQVIWPNINEMEGRYLEQGQELGYLARLDELRVVTLVKQRDAALWFDQRQDSAQVRLAGSARQVRQATMDDRTPVARFRLEHASLAAGGDVRVDPNDPAGRQLLRPEWEMWLRLPASGEGGDVLPGQRADVRFELESRPLYWQVGRRLLQLLQSKATAAKWI